MIVHVPQCREASAALRVSLSGLLGVWILVIPTETIRADDSRFGSATPATPTAAADESSSPRRWTLTSNVEWSHPGIGGSFTITRGSIVGTGTRISVDSLGLDEAHAFGFGLRWDWEAHGLELRYRPFSFSGRATTSDPLIFHGVTYPAGETIETDLRLDFLTLRYDFKLVDRDWAEFRVGPQLNYWRFSARLHSLGPSSIDDKRTFASSMLGGFAGGEIRTSRLHLGGEASLGWNLGDYSLIEFIAYAGMDWTDSARLDIGYRSIAFDMNATTNDGDFFVQGPFVMFSLAF
ncbi:MAG: hypothetical protein KDC38_06360 [Planctomycetes bacterium]|nr:hypothetical protein [Planctomycetota bacterium]